MKKFLFAIGILFCSFQLMGQHELCLRSTEGTEFWFGFMEGRNYNQSGHYLQITVTSAYNTNFRLTYGAAETLYGSYPVAANSSKVLQIPWEMFEVRGSESAEYQGLHLVANDPVNVYALNWDDKSADVAVIYPLESIGDDYFVMCYTPHVSENNGKPQNGRNSEFLLVATQNNTKIEITPSVETAGNKPAGIPFSISLNRGQTYQVQSMNKILPNQGDLTGSYIKADKPIGVYSGNLATSVPKLEGVNAWDHLYEQMPPLYSWGREYYTVPMMGRDADRYRVLASEDGTSVTIDVLGSFQLDRGEFNEFVLTKNQASRITADKPVLVAQFSQSQSIDQLPGDPSMIVLSSTSQSKNNVTFEAYDLRSITSHYINIISKTNQVANLRFDGASFSTLGYFFQPFAGTDYSFVQMPVVRGTHTLLNTQGDQGFLAYVYGFGELESFGYGVGFNLNVVLDLGKSTNFNGDTVLLCAGDTVTLDPGPYFDSYLWSTTETTQSIKVTTEGMYKVTAKVGMCPDLHDSVYVFYSDPQLEIVADRLSDCAPETINLQAKGNDITSFLWHTNTIENLRTTADLTVDSTANYVVTVRNSMGCLASDTAEVVLFGKPPVSIQADSLVCGGFATQLAIDFAGYPESLWKTPPGSFSWKAANSAVQLLNQSDSAATLLVPDYGTYEVYYKLTTKDGCVSGDTVQIQFSPGPNIGILGESFYDCDPVTITLQADVADPQGLKFIWQKMNSDTLGLSNTLEVDSTALYQLTVINQYGCASIDTADVIIFGNPPIRIYADSLICGGLSTVVHVDFSTYPATLWNGGSGGFEWNTDKLTLSDERDSMATVTALGYDTYEVYYKLRTKDGCVSGDTIQVRFSPQPTADFDFTFQPVCKSYSGTLTYTGTASAAAKLEWTPDRAAISETVVPSEYLVTVEPYDGAKPSITLVVDDAGCRDTVYRKEPDSFADERKLDLDFTADKTVDCGELTSQLTATSSKSDLSYLWFSGLDSIPGNPISITLSRPGYFDVGLKATSSETGCSETLSQMNYLQVIPAPTADFSVDNSRVPLDDPWIQFYNHSQFGDSFTWDFGDGQSATDFEPLHQYNNLGQYEALLIVDSYLGCSDTISMLLQVLLNGVTAPNAFRPSSDISANRVFLPKGLGLFGGSFKLQIFDRWGQVVFETTSADNPWDGRDKSGKDAPMGNYIWLVKYADIDGSERTDKGQILLIR